MDRIPVSGLIKPIFDSDNYPVIDPRFGIDGLRSLDTTQQMFDLPLERRRAGMVVGIPVTVSNTVSYYKLKPEGNGITWSIGATSNWDGFLTSFTASNAIPIKYLITNETITVPTNYEYLIWGSMTISASGSFVNDGKTYVINGTIGTVSDGSVSGTGDIKYVTVPSKYTTTQTIGTSGTTITHNLKTSDIVYSVRDSTGNFVYVNVEVLSDNTVSMRANYQFNSARVTIIG
jgi:hypothetical protein